MIWDVSWARSVDGIDIESNADIEAESATDAVKKFMFLFPEVKWRGHKLKAEKNNTYFVFVVESETNSSWFGIKLRRI